ncbi:hypothetical protein LCGC14_0808540 [marine sediment metagenome]|uniref:3'-5' exoribonuclease Rv2179c-like domain-containing protein n=1 Tax=marine sediment metagenome TaxID=412755 RepID=A0A0F9Q7K3_9ZZZZ
MSKHLMIDIETLSTRSNAAIVSIGACMFNPELEYDEWPCAGMLDSFIVGVNPDYYYTGRFHVDPKIEAWWKRQSKEARAGLKINMASTLPLAMDKFTTWVEEQGFVKTSSPWKEDSGRVWANPPQFDLVILRDAAQHTYGSYDDVPWHYRQETCCRTHSYLNRKHAQVARAFPPLIDGLVAHRADHDAIRQARMVQLINRQAAELLI